MNNASLELGGTNWAEKDGNLLGYAVGDTSGRYVPREFDFSRGSNLAATRVDENGLIEKGRENLLLQSNNFLTTWGRTNITVTSGHTGYDGSSNAWKVYETIANSVHLISQPTSSVNLYTFSVYLKSGTGNKIMMFDGNNNLGVKFNLETRSFHSYYGASIIYNIDELQNGWARYSITSSISSNNFRIYILDDSYNLLYIGDTANYVYIQDAQLEQGLTTTDVIPTTTTTAQAGILENTPRLDYSGGATEPSLLLEPSRTNNIPQSEYIKAIGSTQNMTLLNNASVNPQGLQYATEAVPFQNTSSHIFYKSGMGNATNTFTQSIYAKANGYNFCFIRFDLPTTYAWFDLENGVLGQTQSGITSTIVDAGNGWYRCTATLTTTQYANAVIGVSNQDGATNFAANGTSSVLFWGWQNESGSYPTSYIPTYGTSVTRSSEVCGGAGNSSTFNSTEGVLYAEIAALDNNSTNNREIFITSSSDNSTFVAIKYGAPAKRIEYQYRTTGYSIQAALFKDLVDSTSFLKIAVTWKLNEFKLFINGLQVGSTDTSGNVSPAGTFDVLRFQNFEGKVKQVLTFNTALSDQDLSDLTNPYKSYSEFVTGEGFTWESQDCTNNSIAVLKSLS